MRAARIAGHGGLENLSIETIPDPGDPGPGEVRIRVACAGANFADTLMLAGTYQATPDPPFTPGVELAGIVEAIGRQTDGVFVGDRVMAHCNGGAFAEVAVLPYRNCWLVPPSMPLPVAAGFPVAYGTAHVGLDSRARIKMDEVLLVTGASGGVGLAAVEVGKAMGATVIAAASDAEKLELAKARGADHLVDYGSEPLRDRVKELTGGADVVFDPVGGEMFTQAMRAVRPGGRMLVVGFAGGEVQKIPANILLVKNVDVIGLYWGSYLERDPLALRRSFATLSKMYETRCFEPHLHAVLPFEEIAEAYRILSERRARGKVVVDIGGESLG